MTLDKLRGKLFVSLLLGVVVFIGLSFYADFNEVIEGLGHFRWDGTNLQVAKEEQVPNPGAAKQ